MQVAQIVVGQKLFMHATCIATAAAAAGLGQSALQRGGVKNSRAAWSSDDDRPEAARQRCAA